VGLELGSHPFMGCEPITAAAVAAAARASRPAFLAGGVGEPAGGAA